jgi:hypothetical protein
MAGAWWVATDFQTIVWSLPNSAPDKRTYQHYSERYQAIPFVTMPQREMPAFLARRTACCIDFSNLSMPAR